MYILEVHPGEGGKDSDLFAQDLVNAYEKYSKSLEILGERVNNYCL